MAGRVAEAFELAQRLGQHLGVVVLVDHPLAPAILLQQARREAAIAEAATALPADGLGDPALVFAVDDFLQPRNDVGVAVLTQFDHDPAAAHLVRDSAGGAGAGEGVEDEVVWVCGDMDNSPQ